MTGYGNSCAHPLCALPSTTRNRAGQPTCIGHVLVVVSGSFVCDKHGEASHG